MSHRAIRRAIVLVGIGLAFRASPLPAGEEQPLSAPATDEQIAGLIRDLGDASYEKRVHATRRLCAIGAKARDLLLAAAKSDDAETALRAGRVRNALDRLWLAGTEVSLVFSKTTIAWDEPVDLRITITNRCPHPARVPFQIDPTERAAVSRHALQVGDMLDAADWLEVRHHSGRVVELRVDDIIADADVTAAVQLRLNGGPVGMLEPGGTVSITAGLFNRGWARYPLLDVGEYTVRFDYVPEWQDEALAAERVGRVTSNKAAITVTTGAPGAVSRGAAVASVTLEREREELVAGLVNKTDQTMVVNKNFARSAPFAEGMWVYVFGAVVREVPAATRPGASWDDFDEARLVEVPAGRAVELARIEIGRLHELLTEAGADVSGDRWTLHFTYSNMCDRNWQFRQGPALLGNEQAPAVLRKPLSRLILSTRYTSNALTAPKPR